MRIRNLFRDLDRWTAFVVVAIATFALVGLAVTNAHAGVEAVYDNGTIVEEVGGAYFVDGDRWTPPFDADWHFDDAGHAAAITGAPATVAFPDRYEANGLYQGEIDIDKLPAIDIDGFTQSTLVIVDVRTGEIEYQRSGTNQYVGNVPIQFEPFMVCPDSTRHNGGFLVRFYAPNVARPEYPNGLFRWFAFYPDDTWERTTWAAERGEQGWNYGLGHDWQQVPNSEAKAQGWDDGTLSDELPEWHSLVLSIKDDDAWRISHISDFVPPRFYGNLYVDREPFDYVYSYRSMPWVWWNFKVWSNSQSEWETWTDGMGEYSLIDETKRNVDGGMIPWFNGGSAGPMRSTSEKTVISANAMWCAVVEGPHLRDASRLDGGNFDIPNGSAVYIPADMKTDPVHPDHFAVVMRSELNDHFWPMFSPDEHAGEVVGICPPQVPTGETGIIAYDSACGRFFYTGPNMMGERGTGWVRYGQRSDFIRNTERHIVWTWGVEPAPWWGGPSDFNIDGRVDTGDLGYLLSRFGEECDCLVDLNGDGVVNTADLGILLSEFEGGPL